MDTERAEAISERKYVETIKFVFDIGEDVIVISSDYKKTDVANDSNNDNAIVISTYDKVSYVENCSIIKKDTNAIVIEFKLDGSNMSANNKTFNLKNWMELSYASTVEENDEY